MNRYGRKVRVQPNNRLLREVGQKWIVFVVCYLSLMFVLAGNIATSQAKSASEVFELASKSTVVVLGYDSNGRISALGSGVVMPDGTVATNYHVVETAVKVRIRYQNQEYPATLLHTDWHRDVCSITVKNLKVPAVRVGSTLKLRVGARVYAIGAPQGLDLTLSEGIVSSLREIKGSKYIQTTAPISAGSSGGGLFDEDGYLVGLTTFYMAKGQNLNFALPVEWISELPVRQTSGHRQRTRTIDWVNRTLDLETKEDWNGMAKHCKRWLVEDPENDFAWFSLGVAYAELNQTAKAIECFQESLRINPKHPLTWFNLGNSYDRLKHSAKAIECFQQVLRIDPENADAWHNLGIAYGTSGQPVKAIDCFQRVLRINPKNAGTWYALGICYNMVGQRQRVIEVYRILKGLDSVRAERLFKEAVLP